MSTGVVAATAVDETTSARPHANAQTGTALRSDFIGAPLQSPHGDHPTRRPLPVVSDGHYPPPPRAGQGPRCGTDSVPRKRLALTFAKVMVVSPGSVRVSG